MCKRRLIARNSKKGKTYQVERWLTWLHHYSTSKLLIHFLLLLQDSQEEMPMRRSPSSSRSSLEEIDFIQRNVYWSRVLLAVWRGQRKNSTAVIQREVTYFIAYIPQRHISSVIYPTNRSDTSDFHFVLTPRDWTDSPSDLWSIDFEAFRNLSLAFTEDSVHSPSNAIICCLSHTHVQSIEINNNERRRRRMTFRRFFSGIDYLHCHAQTTVV